MDSATAAPPISLLYTQYRRQALAIARRILGDGDEAEDVVQEVFSRLCLRPVSFHGKSTYATWLYRVMVNSSINCLRARRRRGRLELEPPLPLTPEQEAIGAQLKERFGQALEEVSLQHQQVLCLRELRGLSYPEIAQLLRIPEGTVKSALNRGRLKVQQALERQGADWGDE